MEFERRLQEAEGARDAGRLDVALGLFRAIADEAAAQFAPEHECRAMLALGQLLNVMESPAEATEALEQAAARAMEAGLALVEAEAHVTLATIAFDAGRSKDGHDALLEAMALYRGLEGPDAQRGLAVAVRLYGEHLGVLGGKDEAAQALRLAQAMFRDLGDATAVAGIEADLAELDAYAR